MLGTHKEAGTLRLMVEKSPALRSVSPFRYPGGKAFLYKYLRSRIGNIGADSCHYAEPFCGGAGAAVILLKSGVVKHLHLNDADPRVYSAWKAILDENERFVDAVHSTPITLDSWHAAKQAIEGARDYSFEVGFATFFLNRTSRSGIISGAGPIGGYNQAGNWKIDARFNREGLVERVRWLGNVHNQITLTNEDALAFLVKSPARLPVEHTLFFIDPPYVMAGGRLYLNAMNEGKHIALSDMLQGRSLPHWVLTYDDHPLIRQLYADQSVADLSVTYSLQSKRKEREVIITDHALSA